MALPAVLASVFGGGGTAAAGSTIASVAGATASQAASQAAGQASASFFGKIQESFQKLNNPAATAIKAVNDLGVKFVNVSVGAIKFISQITDMGQTIRNVGDILTAVPDAIADKISSIPIIGEKIAAPLQAMTTGFKTLFTSISLFPELLKTLSSVSKQLASEYVSMFSPLTVELFQLAIDDLNASIGENLVPVINLAREGFRYFADKVAGLTPTVLPAMETLVVVAKDLAGAFDPLIVAMSDTAKIVAKLVTEFGPAIGAIAKAGIEMTPLYRILTFVTDKIRELAASMGIDLSSDDGKSENKAFRRASTTNVAAIIRQVQENAFGQGSSSPIQKTADYAQRIDAGIVKLYDMAREKLMDIARSIVDLPKNLANILINGSQKVLNAPGDFLKGIIGDNAFSTYFRDTTASFNRDFGRDTNSDRGLLNSIAGRAGNYVAGNYVAAENQYQRMFLNMTIPVPTDR